jgi:hypothetical protein
MKLAHVYSGALDCLHFVDRWSTPVCGPSFSENFLSLSRVRERARTDPYGPRPHPEDIASLDYAGARWATGWRPALPAGCHARVTSTPRTGGASIPILVAVRSSRAEDARSANVPRQLRPQRSALRGLNSKRFLVGYSTRAETTVAGKGFGTIALGRRVR